MHNSKFADPTGLNKRNKSTARDLVRMVEAAYQYPEIRKITTTSQETFRIGKRKMKLDLLIPIGWLGKVLGILVYQKQGLLETRVDVW